VTSNINNPLQLPLNILVKSYSFSFIFPAIFGADDYGIQADNGVVSISRWMVLIG
jgi:hypothetical protein